MTKLFIRPLQNLMANKGQKLHFFIVLSAIVALNACKESNCIDAPDVSNIQVDIAIDRFDQKVNRAGSYEELSQLLNKYPSVKNLVLHADQYPNDSLLNRRYYNLMSNPYIDSLKMDVENEFGDLTEIEGQFETAFKHVKYYYPEVKAPKILTVITGLAHDLYISDSLIVIGLDYFLGPGAKYKPMNQPDYILKRYQKPYMVPQIMMLYASRFIDTEYDDQTALAEMIFYGKAYEFAKNTLPCTPDSLFTGYTSTETKEVNQYENVIWASIIENEYLYETSHVDKQKILGERPKTYEISQECPGRIGRWVGWQIVKKYRQDHPETPLPSLLEMKDARRIFNQSGYKPMN
jgi:gliding motility-associated lipoprotein GldB